MNYKTRIKRARILFFNSPFLIRNYTENGNKQKRNLNVSSIIQFYRIGIVMYRNIIVTPKKYPILKYHPKIPSLI